MSSKKRPPAKGGQDSSKGVESTHSQEASSLRMGNQAEWQTQTRNSAVGAGVDWALITDSVRPLLQHSMIAIQMDTGSQTQNERLHSIVRQSSFSEVHKQQLLTDMQMKESQARAVSKGLQEFFGEDSSALRGDLWECMYRCVEELARGSMDPQRAEWQTSEGLGIPLSQVLPSQSLTQNTDSVVEQFAEHFSVGPLQERFDTTEHAGTAIRQFCRSLYLAIQLDEEEEEETWSMPEIEQ